MPYDNIHDLPDSVRHALPEHAQHIYQQAFNHACEEYKHPESRKDDASREVTAHKVAWSAVKQKYRKNPNTHHWESIK